MKVLFFDECCPKPYGTQTLSSEGLGGTEATVVRVADALQAFVCQHNRSSSDGRYLSLAQALQMDFDVVVSIRVAGSLRAAARAWPRARQLLWLHDLSASHLIAEQEALLSVRPELICVSDFHLASVRKELSPLGTGVTSRMRRIYNPVDDQLQPDGTPVDRNKLIFFSSPDKGLAYALTMFEYLNSLVPQMRLYVANPGYRPGLEMDVRDVVNLGALPHGEMIRHVREALCVFYPNTVFPETFGLVFAEANAVGTPVLTHDLGAAREVLGSAIQIADASDYRSFTKRVLSWREGKRPLVRANDAFRLRMVAAQWTKACSRA